MGRGNLQSMLRDIDTKTKIQFPQMWETSKPCQSFPTDWLSSTKQSQPLKQAAILHHCIHLPREADNINTLISKYNILIEMQSHMLVRSVYKQLQCLYLFTKVQKTKTLQQNRDTCDNH